MKKFAHNNNWRTEDFNKQFMALQQQMLMKEQQEVQLKEF